MLNYFVKPESFHINKNTVVILFILGALIYLSTYLYDLHVSIIEGFEDMDPKIKELLENYLKKEGIFQSDGVELQSQSRHPPGNMQVVDKNIFSKLYLRDFYIKSSFQSCVIDDKGEYLSEEALPFLLRQGIRFYDFDVFKLADEDEPMIAVNKRDDTDIVTSLNNIYFFKAINKLKRHAFINSLPNSKDPLFIHLKLKSIYDKDLLLKIYSEIQRVFNFNTPKNKPSLDTFYYKKQDNKEPYVFNNIPRKRTFIFVTINYEIESSAIDNLLKLENVYRTMPFDTTEITREGTVFTINHSSLTNLGSSEAKNTVNRNMQNFTICMPDQAVGSENYNNYAFNCEKDQAICYPEPMLYGCQFMPTCYFNPKNLSIYNELFEKRIQSGFIVKHPDLRLADIYVQSNEYEGVTGNESATLDSIESSGKNQFPGS